MKKKLSLLGLVLMTLSASLFAQGAVNEKVVIPDSLKHWKKGVDLSLQMTQNYISSNWYNGGNSNMAAMADIKGWINYDNKDRIQWENLLELKYGLSTTFTDDLAGRAYHMTDDLSQFKTKFGYRVGKSTWYASANLDFSTPLFNSYTIDTDERTSALISPIRTYVGLGMDYKYENKKKNIDLSVFIAPVTYRLIYVNDTTVMAGGLGIEKTIGEYAGLSSDQKSWNQIGSMFKFNYRQKFNENITLTSLMSFFTDYKGIEYDWEIVGDFKLYKLLTARVSIHPRYDTTSQDDGWNSDAQVQFKEFVSIGLAYRLEK